MGNLALQFNLVHIVCKDIPRVTGNNNIKYKINSRNNTKACSMLQNRSVTDISTTVNTYVSATGGQKKGYDNYIFTLRTLGVLYLPYCQTLA